MGGGGAHFIFVWTEGKWEGRIYCRREMKLKNRGGGGTGGVKEWKNPMTMVFNMGRQIYALPHLVYITRKIQYKWNLQGVCTYAALRTIIT